MRLLKKPFLDRIANYAFWGILCLFTVAITKIGLYELLNMTFHGTDFCLYDSSIWNATYGTWLKCNISHSRSYLGIHFSPILFIFVPFYKLGAGSWLLIVARSLAAIGGAILLRLYAVKYQKLPVWVGCIFGISFLLHPMVQAATLSEFHGTILELFFIPLLFVALESGEKKFFWISVILLLSVREDTWLYTLGLSLLILWKRDKRLAIQVAIVSIVWGVMALAVFMPYFYGGLHNIGRKNAMFSLYLARYRGYSLSMLFAFLKPRLLVDLKLVFPLLFLPVLGGRYFLLMWIPIIQIQLGRSVLQKYLLIHYPACILPFVYVAGIHGWKNLEEFLKARNQAVLKILKGFAGVGVLCLSFAFFYTHSLVAGKKRYELFASYLVNLRMKTGYELLNKIPKDASLSLQGSLFHVASHRRNVYMFSGFPPQAHFPGVKTDYIMLDMGRSFIQVKNFWGVVEKLLSGKEYGVVTEKDGFIILKRGYPTVKNPLVLHRLKFRIQGENMHHLTGIGEWGKIFDWKAARVAREKRDGEGILAFGVRRLLPPGTYTANFSVFLKGIPDWDAVTLAVKRRLGGKKTIFLAKKTVKFKKIQSKIFIIPLTFILQEEGLVEPILFYGGHGTVGLDYVEFNRVEKGNLIQEEK